MEELIKQMIKDASSQGERVGFKLMEYVRELMIVLTQTINAPYDWRHIGQKLADEWNNGTFETSDMWVWNALELYDYGADECYGAATFDDE